jgi:methyl-CpG-binding domain protein 4
VIPPRSPHGLLQEDLFPDEWKCLVVCIMLNCTTRKQIEKVMPEFFRRWPTPNDFLKSSKDEVANLIAFLGFKNRRTERLFSMTSAYVERNWKHARELPGIGEYAARMWQIFFLDVLGEDPPNDGALLLYWKWRKKLEGDLLVEQELFNRFFVDEEGDEGSTARNPRTESNKVSIAIEHAAA